MTTELNNCKASAGEDIIIENGLRRIRRLRAWFIGWLAGALPFFSLVVWVKPSDWVFPTFAVVWFFVWIVLVITHGLSRCPACYRLFNVKGLYGNPCTSKCLNCGISLKRKEK
jgi:hypothetical protein